MAGSRITAGTAGWTDTGRNMETAIVIPVLNPDKKTTDFVGTLINAGFKNILVVDDGSGPAYSERFDMIRAHGECTVLVHEANKGKGAALKTAFAYLHGNRPDIDVCVTADGDGQHDVDSINKCLEKYTENTDAVIFGGRDFSGQDIPAKSRFGNRLSKVVYRFACGIKINDTQTGLRVIPAKYFERFSKLKGDRYEYETSMILDIANGKLPYAEVPIKTIYIDDNASTHFNAVKDSIKIYVIVLKNLIKFLINSLACFLVDEGLFYVFLTAFAGGAMSDSARTYVAVVCSRILSSILNFFLNRKTVFNSQGSLGKTMAKYYILAVCQMGVMMLLVDLIAVRLLHFDGALEVVIKCVVDICLFFISYTVQRKWVFREEKKPEK